MIDLFVADKEQYKLYRKSVDKNINIIIGVKGLKNIRDFIINYYPENATLLCMDDDVEMIKMKNPNNEEASCFKNELLNLRKEVENAFKICEERGQHLWGLYPVDNHFYMKNEISHDYKFIIGNFFGLILNKRANRSYVEQKGDYERSIRHYLLDGGVVRINYLCAKTKFKKNTGGANETEFDRANKIIKDQDILIKYYPDLFYLKKKKDGLLNPVLKDSRRSRLELSSYIFD
tara:strand:- start:403 stop:1101 length:699 start_codon:yes stop_codon:yes gene_type:complete